MKLIELHKCPSCEGPLQITRLRCRPCDLSLDGHFAAPGQELSKPSAVADQRTSLDSPANEFSKLSGEDLHFLRIFVHCEGRIRDMESALGLSYPTIKSRLARMKTQLGVAANSLEASTIENTIREGTASEQATRAFANVDEVLSALSSGAITHTESVKLIRKLTPKKK